MLCSDSNQKRVLPDLVVLHTIATWGPPGDNSYEQQDVELADEIGLRAGLVTSHVLSFENPGVV